MITEIASIPARLRRIFSSGAPAPEPTADLASFWELRSLDIQQELGAGPDGLSSLEAAERLQRYGPNRLDKGRRQALIVKFLGRFRNPLILILLAAAGISAAMGDVPSFAIITAMVILGVALDFLQEYRAERAAEALKRSVALHVRALRDGRETNLPAAGLVPGDVVLLSAGDLVPADGRLLDAKDFFVNQALLTGESYPVEKHCGDALQPSDSNSVFMGTSVISGSARLLIVATGRRSQLGGIAKSLSHAPPATAFETGIRDFGLMIMRLTVLLASFALLVNLAFHRPPLDSFLFAIALAVGLAPELLPMIFSVTLATGAIRMARSRVIVKRLASIHNLGSMDVLCTDKTGTLTEAHIRLVRAVDLSGVQDERVLRLAYVNSFFESGLRNPLDEAILERGAFDLGDFRKIDEVPFDFERRRVSILVEHEAKRLLIVKGAPEEILGLSRYWDAAAGGNRQLDAAALSDAQRLFSQLSADGFRVLGIAWREVPADHDHAVIGDEQQLVFAGFAAFLDPPKESARKAIEGLSKLGITVKIITGDNELVAQHVCVKLGFEITGLLTGAEVGRLSDEALSARAEDVNLFCRVTPAQKSRIIGAIRRRGHVVGYLGDGINDAPSLHSADVGISVAGAADVAKEAAEMIMLEPDLGVLEQGVREGRRTFGNIMKYVMMGTSSNFGNMFSMAGATLMLPFLPMLPIQILLNNLLYDLSEIAIPMDEVDPEMIEQPRHWDMRFVRNFMLIIGSVSSAFDFLTFGLLEWVFHADEAMFHTGWFIESLATQVLVIFVIRTRGDPLRSRPHWLLAVASIAVVAVAILLPFIAIGAWFGLVALPGEVLVAIAAMTLVYLCLAQVIKALFYRSHAGRSLTLAAG